MNTIKDGGPAFPVPLQPGHSWQGMAPCDGMSLRDYMAIHASESDILKQGELIRLSTFSPNHKGTPNVLPNNWHITARYMHADAMLKTREVTA